jgi:demethoxyubiquinone hydroxylase (CLK1/Coq7/Cat5 family)|tara:strand:- start:2009 stop:2233 length:225 start_codon:yes stop_codon:yes gene_type:complete
MAIWTLTNITAYALDQGDIENARVYFACVKTVIEKHIEGQVASLNNYQTKALTMILHNFDPIVAKLKEELKRRG